MKEIMKDVAAGVTIIVLLTIVLFHLSSCAAFQNKKPMEPIVKNVCSMACDQAEDLTIDQCERVCSNTEEYADICKIACSIAVDIGGMECDGLCVDKLNETLKNAK
jgi:hypothetical protein